MAPNIYLNRLRGFNARISISAARTGKMEVVPRINALLKTALFFQLPPMWHMPVARALMDLEPVLSEERLTGDYVVDFNAIQMAIFTVEKHGFFIDSSRPALMGWLRDDPGAEQMCDEILKTTSPKQFLELMVSAQRARFEQLIWHVLDALAEMDETTWMFFVTNRSVPRWSHEAQCEACGWSGWLGECGVYQQNRHGETFYGLDHRLHEMELLGTACRKYFCPLCEEVVLCEKLEDIEREVV